MHPRAVVWSLFLAALTACSGGDGDGTANDGPSGAAASGASTYLAFATSFAGYRTWPTTFHLAAGAASGDVHTSAPRSVFVNARPPHGSTTFPIGTIIVKSIDTDDPATQQIFAMVKRGGGFNSSGALDWEWFELKDVGDGTVTIVWRGVGPPLGEKYGGDPNAGCNSCHGGARDNDFVQADPLRLSSF